MAIHESKKQSDLEKRLKLLRNQVYGKQTSISYQISDKKSDTQTNRPANTSLLSDVVYLNQDLIKIITLSTLALGVQFILFFLWKNHILDLNLF